MHLSTGGSSSAGSTRGEFRQVRSFEGLPDGGPQKITTSLYAGIPLVMPGEVAPAQRHCQSAPCVSCWRAAPHAAGRRFPYPPFDRNGGGQTLPTSSAGSGDIIASFGPVRSFPDPCAAVSGPHVGSEGPAAQGRSRSNRNRDQATAQFVIVYNIHFSVQKSYTFCRDLCIAVLSHTFDSNLE